MEKNILEKNSGNILLVETYSSDFVEIFPAMLLTLQSTCLLEQLDETKTWTFLQHFRILREKISSVCRNFNGGVIKALKLLSQFPSELFQGVFSLKVYCFFFHFFLTLIETFSYVSENFFDVVVKTSFSLSKRTILKKLFRIIGLFILSRSLRGVFCPSVEIF